MRYGDVLRKFEDLNKFLIDARNAGKKLEDLEQEYKMLFFLRLLTKNRSDYDDPRSFNFNDEELDEKFKWFEERRWPHHWEYLKRREKDRIEFVEENKE